MEGVTAGWEDRKGSDHTKGLECQARKPKYKSNAHYKLIKHLLDASPYKAKPPPSLNYYISDPGERLKLRGVGNLTRSLQRGMSELGLSPNF